MNNANDAAKLKPTDQDFFNYLKLNIMRSNNALPPDGLNELTAIVGREIRAKQLEDLYQKVIREEEKVETYNDLYEQLKSELEKSIKNSLSGKKELSQASKDLIDYFKIEIKRCTSNLDENDIKKLELLRQSIQKVRTLEEAHRRVSKQEIPTKVLVTLREKYKKDVIDEIKELGFDEKELIPDDKIIYTKLDELSKQEVPKRESGPTLLNIEPILNIKKESKTADIKSIIDNKMEETKTETQKQVEEPKPVEQKPVEQQPSDDNLYDVIAAKGMVKRETDNSELAEENKRLREENELLKTKVDFLKEQIRELNRDIAIKTYTEEMPREYIELARYFKLDLKRTRSEISDEELKELRNLTKGTNKMIDEIEDIVRMKSNGELSIKEYNEEHDRVYNKYKEMLEAKYNETKGSTR